jgi:hypothetical protein
MLDEIEALVGHVFVVGGRAVSTNPPGALVQLPPRKAQRGREQDTFFTLVTAAGTNQAQAAFYEQLAKLAADLYFRSGGGVTSGLREAVSAVNSHLLEHNQIAGQRYEANMICVILRGREVYVARTGSCLCLYRQGDSFVTFPDDLRDEYALNGLPLGYSPVPDIRLAHYDVAPNHVMVLAEAGLAQADRDALYNALGSGGVQAVIEPLKGLAGQKLQATVIEFVSNDTPDPVVISPQPSTKILRSSSAPVSTPVSPSSVSAAPASTPVKPPGAPAPLPGSPNSPNSPALPADQLAPRKSTPVRAQIESRVDSHIESRREPIAKVLSSRVRAAEPTPELADTEPEARPVSEPLAEAAKAGRRAVGETASFLSRVTRGMSFVLDRILPEPEEGAPHIPAMLGAALAILVPVVIVFIVVFLQLMNVDMTQFEQMVHDIQVAADEARRVPLMDVDKAKTAWLGILQRIEIVETSTGRSGDGDLNRIRGEAQAILDGFAKVTRRIVTPLRNFPESGKLVGPIVQGGVMYTLDTSQSSIYLDRLSTSMDSIVARGAQPVVQQGQAVGARSVRNLIDITWMVEGGIQRGNVLAALDTQGIIVTYSPTFAPATSQPLPGTDRWVKPSAITAWQKRLYILDPGANQIWRYIPEGYSYPNAPEEYFEVEPRPDLKDAVDFAIDTTGKVYVLFANGTLKKYNAGAEQPFSFRDLPDGSLRSANSMYLDNDAALPAIYITDPLDNSVYQVTVSGTFLRRYRAADNNAFRSLTGVFADRGNLYVTSGSLVYYFSVSDLVSTPVPTPQTTP